MKNILTLFFFIAIVCVSNEAMAMSWNSLQSELFFAGCSDECRESSEAVGDIVKVKDYCECVCHTILHTTDSYNQANMFVMNALNGEPKDRKVFDSIMYQCFMVNQKKELK